MSELYYDGPIVLQVNHNNGPQASAWLKWSEAEGDLASSILEAIGIDEESVAEAGVFVEVHARVRVSIDPYRAALR